MKVTWSIALAMVCSPSLLADATFEDSTFLDSDWELVSVSWGSGGSSTARQQTSGGYPGAFRRIDNTVVGPDGYIVGFHFHRTALHTPSTDGVITSVEYTEDSIHLAGGGDGEATGPSLRQGDDLYLGNVALYTPEFYWTRKGAHRLTASDFILLDASGVTHPAQHPDFSPAGTTIQFGFFRANSGGGYSQSAGIDNWRVGVRTAPATACGTLVGGTIAGSIWSKEGSPYCVTNDIFVGGLTIREGVEVRFGSNHVFEVAGRLRVLGTAEAPVHFYPADWSVGWQGILFRDAVPGSYFVHTIIEGSRQSGLRITNTPPALTNCWIINNTTEGEGGGIKAEILNGADFILSGCVVSNNVARRYGGGVQLDLKGGRFAAEDCTFSENTGGAAGGGFLAWAESASLRLLNCTSANNRVHYAPEISGHAELGGIGVRYRNINNPSFRLEIANCHVVGNSTRSAGGNNWADGAGIGVVGGETLIKNCWIEGNEARNGRTGGGGVYLSYPASARIENCVIARNQIVGSSHEAAGIWGYSSPINLQIVNCTLIENGSENPEVTFTLGASDGVTTITNSILWRTAAGSILGPGNYSVGYSCVKGGLPGIGNISFNPALCPDNYSLLALSPCVDAGDPALEFRDGCIDNAGECTPFARGTARNDMGAYGGPWVCAWTDPTPQPKIRIQPDNRVVLEGDPAAIGVIATGDTPLNYQWYRGGLRLDGATNAVLRWPSVALTDASVQATATNAYRVEVSNSLGSVSSMPVWLMVSELAVSAAREDGQVWLTIRRVKPIAECEIKSAETAVGPWTTIATLELDAEETRWPLPGSGYYSAAPVP